MSGALLAAAPALPLHKAGPYVAAAYIVFVVLLLVYLGIMGWRTGRTERQLAELRARLRERERGGLDGGEGGEGGGQGGDRGDEGGAQGGGQGGPERCEEVAA